MNPRFDPASIEGCSEIPASRGREVLSLAIEVDPISGKESIQWEPSSVKCFAHFSLTLASILRFWVQASAIIANLKALDERALTVNNWTHEH
jgi:hypothetical protein